MERQHPYFASAAEEREDESNRLDDAIAEVIEGLAAEHATDDAERRADFWERVIAIAVDRATTACRLPNGDIEETRDLSLATWMLADAENLRRVREFLVDACDGLRDTPEELADEAADICASAGI